MTTDKTREKIAEVSAEPITAWIAELVQKEVQRMICMRDCHKVCDAPCWIAIGMMRHLARIAWQEYARLN